VQRPARLGGDITYTPDSAAFKGNLELADAKAIPIDASAERTDDVWRIELQPVSVPIEGRTITLGRALKAEIAGERAVLHPVPLTLDSPRVVGIVEAAGKHEEGRFDISWIVRGLSIEEVEVPDLTARTRFGEGPVGVDLVWGQELFVSGTVGETNDLQVKLDVPRIQETPLRQYVESTGAILMNVHLTGTATEPEATGSIRITDLTAPGLKPISFELPVVCTEGDICVAPTEIETPYGTVLIEGRIPFVDPGPVQATAKLDLEDSSPLLEHVPEDLHPWMPMGRLKATVSIRGGERRLEAVLEPVGFEPPFPIGPLSTVYIDAFMEEEGLSIDVVSKLGLGPVRAQGIWRFQDEGTPLELKLVGTEALVIDQHDVRVRASPDLMLRWAEGEGVHVTGKVQVPLALYYAEFGGGTDPGEMKEPGVPGLRTRAAQIGGIYVPFYDPQPTLKDVHLDFEVEATGECRIENSRVGAMLEGRARIRGTGEAPIMSGSGSIKSGEVRLTTGIFVRIRRAEVDIPSEVGKPPTVHFEGVAGTVEEEIHVMIRGLVERPELILHSSPPRPQEELLAMVAFGQAPGRVDHQAALGAFARKLFEQYNDRWPRAKPGSRLGRRLRFTLEQPKELSAQKPWELPASGTASSTVIRTEYFVTSAISIIAERDMDANWGGDLKLRLRFR
jgi:hypothetical protein